jgi:exodeoxyribonuclease V alpha subunit
MNANAKKIINNKLNELAKSTFRSSFHLRKYMNDYIDEKGLEKVKEHAYDFVRKKLKPAEIKNDGKQTPMKGHPVFIAQHATATCCRGCLEKWHHIDKGIELSDNQVNYVVELIMAWITKEYKSK